MGHVTVTINGRQYRMGCEDGEEAHLTHLAEELDHRVMQLREKFGDIGEARLIIMASLMVGDELDDALRRLNQLKEEIAALQDTRAVVSGRSQASQTAIAAALNAAAERIEEVTKSLNESLGEGVGIG
jgi:cell division protein ZapA